MRPPASSQPPHDDADRAQPLTPSNLHREAESRALLAAIVESSDDAIISKNTDGVITSWNRAAERIFGYSAQEALGKHITLIAMPGREWEMARILGRILSNQRVSHYETIRRHKDGHPVLVSLTVSPIRSQDGVIIGASKIARDITARKKSEHILQQTEKLAMLGRLSASIAHEINNPLEAVTNLLYLLRSYPLPTEGYDYLQMAETELTRISNIVTQTLTFHKQNAQPAAANITAVVDSALAFLRHRLNNSHVQLIRRYRPAQPVYCLEGEIHQVILNLIANSLDAIQQFHAELPQNPNFPPSPAARLILACRPATHWHTQQPGVRLTVADNGCGIPPSALARIFEAFFTTKGSSGNGLGLWITSEILTRHHGHIRVRSSNSPTHHGTVFFIFLPSSGNEISNDPTLAAAQQSL